MTSKRGIPLKNVFEVLQASNEHLVRLGGLTQKGTWFRSIASYSSDIINLSLICQIIQPRVVFEIGTLKGYTAFQFALNTPSDTKIFTLDLPQNGNTIPALSTTLIDDQHVNIHANMEKYYFEGSNVSLKINCLFGDSAKFDFAPFHKNVDFFFIDGAHSYEYVRSDTLNAVKCCHPGSVIAWHDFGRVGVNGVSKWILEFAKDHEIYAIPGGSLAFMVV